jgi:hypothetical protein
MLARIQEQFFTTILAQALCCLSLFACAPVDAQDADIENAVTHTTTDSGFWFVNTHHSPQSFDYSCPKFCPAVMRYEQCQNFGPSSFQEMISSLEPGVPVCIMVHGSFVDTPSSCRESTCTWKWLKGAGCGHRMQMIYFHWPSFRHWTPLVAIDTNQLGRRASRNGYYLAELIQHLPPDCPVCLMGHSHGTRVISSGLHLLAGGAIQGIQHPFARVNGRQIRTVFTGSAIDHHWLNPGKRYDRALYSTQCLLNMTNHYDPALAVYPFRLPLLVRPALGMTGLTRLDRCQLGPQGEKVLDFDVSSLIGASHLWPYYFQHPGLAMAMRNYVYFPDVVPAMTVALEEASVE